MGGILYYTLLHGATKTREDDGVQVRSDLLYAHLTFQTMPDVVYTGTDCVKLKKKIDS